MFSHEVKLLVQIVLKITYIRIIRKETNKNLPLLEKKIDQNLLMGRSTNAS